MTRVLAFDHATGWSGLALVEADARGDVTVVAEQGVWRTEARADQLAMRAERLLADAGWSRTSIDVFAATRGPGSFTGLRVALGTVRGLCLAADRPGIGVGTLEAMVEAHGPAELDRLAVLDAGRGEFFVARFDPVASPPQSIEAPELLDPSALLLGCATLPAVLIPGARSTQGSRPTAETAVARPSRWAAAPRGGAAAAGTIALSRGAVTAADGHDTLTPLYVRLPDAVVKQRAG